MFRTIAIAATAASALAAPAFAGGLAPVAAEPAPAAPAPMPVNMGYDWTGGYAGVQLGYGTLDLGATNDEDYIYGAQVGYDYDFGKFVAGAELDYVGSNINWGGTDLNSLMHAKLRLGMDAGRALVYAVGGGARADTSIGDDYGWVAGAGVEYKVMDNVGVGAEYLYHKFGDFNGTGNDLDGSTIALRVNYRF